MQKKKSEKYKIKVPKNAKQNCSDWMFVGLIKVKYNIYTKLFTKIG